MDWLEAAKKQVNFIGADIESSHQVRVEGYLEAITYALIAIAERLESK